MSETLDTNVASGSRPTFLTVLCILTFIGSGLGVIGGLMGLIGSSALGMFAPQGTMIVTIIGLIAAALCLFGAVKMWGLYKQGFMIYVGGAVLSIIGSVVSALTIRSYMEESMGAMNDLGGEYGELSSSVSNMAADMAASAAWTAVVVAVIINVVFILLYNANKKHLVK